VEWLKAFMLDIIALGLFGGLFYGAFSVTRPHSVDDMVTSE
jgi:hypothetical protein